jgi:membrane-associated phospholipid phosphatase
VHKFFILTYIVLGVILFVVTPFDFAISQMVYGEEKRVLNLISQLVYIPAYFLGFFGIAYYCQRIIPILNHWFLKYGFVSGALIGIFLLSYVFINSMRFLAYYIYIIPVVIIILMKLAWDMSKKCIQKRLYEFDYLAGIEIVMISLLYLTVNTLKKIVGRARFYLAVENEQLYSNWYEIRGTINARDYFSFPSGHMSFVTISVWFVIVTVMIPQFRKYFLPALISSISWIIIHGYIRIQMGEHYLTDVIFSVILGLAILHVLLISAKLVVSLLENKFNLYKFPNQEHIAYDLIN